MDDRDLALLAHDAAVAGDAWERVVASTAALFAASGGALFTPEPDPHAQYLNVATGTAAPAIGPYVAQWLPEDAWNLAIAGTPILQRSCEARVGTGMVPAAELHRTRFHGDFLRPHDLEHVLVVKLCTVLDGLAPPTQLTLFRHAGAPDFTADDARRLEHIGAHLRSAIRSHWAHRALAQLPPGAATGTGPACVWVLDARGHITFENAAAVEATRTLPFIGIRDGRLLRIGGLELDAHLRDPAASTLALGAQHVVQVDLHGEPCALWVNLAPIHRHEPMRDARPRRQVQVIVTVYGLPEAAARQAPRATPDFRHSRQAARAHLTPVERAVFDALLEGLAPKAIATLRGISLHTARTHIRSIHHKLQCRRNVELVARYRDAP